MYRLARNPLRTPNGGVACFAVIAVLLGLAACLVLQSRHAVGLLETANKIGPAAQSLVQGHGLAVCYGDNPDEPAFCEYAQRMPIAPVTVAVLYRLFGSHTQLAALVKTLVFLLPVLLAFSLAWHSSSGSSVSSSSALKSISAARLVTFGVFLLAVLLPPWLDTAVNLNFEEAYFYSWFALAVALLLFSNRWRVHPFRWASAVWLSLAIVYLTKSSMLLATGFLAAAAVVHVIRAWHRPLLAAILLIACLSVPFAWGAYQHRTTGRFTFGTSLDGVNLYKGNNPAVLALYPAFRGASLDGTEASLFASKLSLQKDRLQKEWILNDFASAQAVNYIRSHPSDTLRLGLRKATVFFLGFQRNLGEDPYPRLVELAFDLGLLLFRVMLLTALALALRSLLISPARRFPAAVFLGCVLCTSVPYIVGFALTRHSLVLILPAAAYLSSLCVQTDEANTVQEPSS